MSTRLPPEKKSRTGLIIGIIIAVVVVIIIIIVLIVIFASRGAGNGDGGGGNGNGNGNGNGGPCTPPSAPTNLTFGILPDIALIALNFDSDPGTHTAWFSRTSGFTTATAEASLVGVESAVSFLPSTTTPPLPFHEGETWYVIVTTEDDCDVSVASGEASAVFICAILMPRVIVSVSPIFPGVMFLIVGPPINATSFNLYVSKTSGFFIDQAEATIIGGVFAGANFVDGTLFTPVLGPVDGWGGNTTWYFRVEAVGVCNQISIEFPAIVQ